MILEVMSLYLHSTKLYYTWCSYAVPSWSSEMNVQYSPASSSEGVQFSDFSELTKVSPRSDMVLGVSVSDSEVDPVEVRQKLCWHLQSPGGSSSWYTGSETVELELQEFLGLTGRGMNCCGSEYLITAGKKNTKKTYTAVSRII